LTSGVSWGKSVSCSREEQHPESNFEDNAGFSLARKPLDVAPGREHLGPLLKAADRRSAVSGCGPPTTSQRRGRPVDRCYLIRASTHGAQILQRPVRGRPYTSPGFA
jgi:hypothetical protein